MPVWVLLLILDCECPTDCRCCVISLLLIFRDELVPELFRERTAVGPLLKVLQDPRVCRVHVIDPKKEDSESTRTDRAVHEFSALFQATELVAEGSRSSPAVVERHAAKVSLSPSLESDRLLRA